MDHHPRRILAAALVVLVAACAGPDTSATPLATGGSASASATGTDSAATAGEWSELVVDEQRIASDLSALQSAADDNGGVRTSGTGGYEASVDHVASVLRDLGFTVETPAIEFVAFRDRGGTLEVAGRTFRGPDELRALIYSPAGDVRGRIVALQGSGCDAGDFDGVAPGSIILTTQGGCFRRDQAINAAAAGAVGLVVGYPGRGPGEIFRPTLIDPAGMEIPVASVTDDAARLLVAAAEDEDVVRLVVDTERAPASFRNVIAELGDGPSVVMLGAHLDSVLDGPGINDNGSGVAALLEVARGVAAVGVPDGWAVRIGLWGGEEFGTIGSRAYVDEGLSDGIAAYINLDMAGSVSGANLVYDEEGAAPGSGQIRDEFEAWFDAHGEASERVDLGGSSDHYGFIVAGVPTGGLFAGASVTGSAAQPTASGGSGTAPDPCYHIACDDLDNVDPARVALFAEATFAVTYRLMRP